MAESGQARRGAYLFGAYHLVRMGLLCLFCTGPRLIKKTVGRRTSPAMPCWFGRSPPVGPAAAGMSMVTIKCLDALMTRQERPGADFVAWFEASSPCWSASLYSVAIDLWRGAGQHVK